MRMGPESNPAASGGLSRGLRGAGQPGFLWESLRVVEAPASTGRSVCRKQVLGGLCADLCRALLGSLDTLA